MRSLFIGTIVIGVLMGLAIAQTGFVQVSSGVQQQRGGTPCNQGFYWTGQSCVACLAVQGGGGFCTCTQPNQCDQLTCVPGKYSYGNTCVTCPSGCTSCGLNAQNNAIVCYSCSQNNFLVGSVCLQYPGCGMLNQQNAQCVNCNGSSFFNANLQGSFSSVNSYTVAKYFSQTYNYCEGCLPSCIQCQSTNTCQYCNFVTYWKANSNTQSGSCASCMTPFVSTGCSSCTWNATANNNNGAGICQTCNFGYYMAPLTSANNQPCQPCSKITTQCTFCSDSATCTQCSPNFFLANSTTCQPCGANCNTCTSNTQCTVCNAGYFSSTGVCYPNMVGCATPQALSAPNATTLTSTCGACQDTFYRVNASTTGQPNLFTCTLCSQATNTVTGQTPSQWARCAGPNDSPALTPLQPTQCVDNFFILPNNGTNQCVQYASPNGCLTLQNTTNTVCQACLPGFQLYGTNCQQCYLGCSSCNQNANNLVCAGCLTGYYNATATLVSTTPCKSCSTLTVAGVTQSGCATCNSTACLTCVSSGFYYNQVQGQCVSCSSLAQGCSQCTQTTCTQCANGYFPNNIANVTACYQCPSECATCAAPGSICTTCAPGYILIGTGCVDIDQANCYLVRNGKCEVCEYGFYLNNGLCLQCTDPYSGFVCRTNELPANAGSDVTNRTNGGGNSTNGTNGTNGTDGTNPSNQTSQPTSANLISIAAFLLAALLAY